MSDTYRRNYLTALLLCEFSPSEVDEILAAAAEDAELLVVTRGIDEAVRDGVSLLDGWEAVKRVARPWLPGSRASGRPGMN